MDLCVKFIFWCLWNGWKLGLCTSEMKFCKEIKYGWIQVVFITLKQNENLYRIFWIYFKGRFETVSEMWILDVTFRDMICGKLRLQRCCALSTGKQLPAFRRFITFLPIYCMEQSRSWEANRFSVNQENPCILWNKKVHYHVYKCLRPVPILSQTNPVHAPHPTSWIFILILSSHLGLGLPSCHLPLDFPIKTLYTPLRSSINATCPAHLILLDFYHPKNIRCWVLIIKLLII